MVGNKETDRSRKHPNNWNRSRQRSTTNIATAKSSSGMQSSAGRIKARTHVGILRHAYQNHDLAGRELLAGAGGNRCPRNTRDQVAHVLNAI